MLISVQTRIGKGQDFLLSAQNLFGGYFIDEVMDDGLRDGTWTYSYESNVWTDMEEGTEPTTAPTGFDPLLLALALPVIAAVVVVALIIRRRN